MKKNILIIASGTPNVMKVAQLRSGLEREGFVVKVVVTDYVRKHFDNVVEIQPEFFDLSLDSYPEHITLSKWSDLNILFPASANTCAKFAAGICDNIAMGVLLISPAKTLIVPSMTKIAFDQLELRGTWDMLDSLGHYIAEPIDHEIDRVIPTVMIEVEEVINFAKTILSPVHPKLLVLFGDRKIAANDTDFLHNEATPAAIRVIRREGRLHGMDVQEINAANLTNQEAFNEIKTSNFDIMISTLTFNVEQFIKNSTAKYISEDNKYVFDILGDVRAVFPEHILFGFKYTENEKFAINKLKDLKIDGVLWNQPSLMTNTNITGKLLFNNKTIPLNNVSKLEAARSIIIELLKQHLIKANKS